MTLSSPESSLGVRVLGGDARSASPDKAAPRSAKRSQQVSLTWHLLTDSAGVVLSRAAPPVESNLIQKEDTAL